jgi:hypothetical protein
VRGLSEQLHAAERAIDSANAHDPTIIEVRGDTEALALAHGRLAAMWVLRLAPAADDALLLAARAHHLRRWEVPRSSYPDGKAGYLRWRKEQKQRHAHDVEQLLRECGYEDTAILRVQALIRRDNLRTNADAQVIEDAACLVFIETQLASMAPKFEREHLLEVIRKTAAKMSPAALALVGELALGEAERGLLADALA